MMPVFLLLFFWTVLHGYQYVSDEIPYDCPGLVSYLLAAQCESAVLCSKNIAISIILHSTCTVISLYTYARNVVNFVF